MAFDEFDIELKISEGSKNKFVGDAAKLGDAAGDALAKNISSKLTKKTFDIDRLISKIGETHFRQVGSKLRPGEDKTSAFQSAKLFSQQDPAIISAIRGA